MAVGAYGGTPGRNALRPYGILANCRNIGMFFLPGIFASISDQLHRLGFSTSPFAGMTNPYEISSPARQHLSGINRLLNDINYQG